MNKRVSKIFNTPKAEPDATLQNKPSEVVRPSRAGNFALIAERDKDRTLNDLRGSIRDGVISGEVPLQISVDQIQDLIKSDRIATENEESEDPANYSALKQNIKERGQRTPIRVRPKDPNWKPNPLDPQNPGDAEFLLLSGRRRLQACKELNRSVVALIDFRSDNETADQRLQDLQERYFENVARRDLNSFERLVSIGMMAEIMTADRNQLEIAEILHVSRPIVSKGLKVYEHYDELIQYIDINNASLRDIEKAIKLCGRSEGSKSEKKPTDVEAQPQEADATGTPEFFRRRRVGSSVLTLTRNQTGSTVLKITTKHLDASTLEKIEEILNNDGDEEQ